MRELDQAIRELRKRLGLTQQKLASIMEELLRDVASSGVELDDERLRYVVVQIDRQTWEALIRWRDERA